MHYLTRLRLEKLQRLLLEFKKNTGESLKKISDGYHTFDELYKHRMAMTLNILSKDAHAFKAKIHEDGTMFDDSFIVGTITRYGWLTYHYNLKYWNLFDKIPEIIHAPKYNGELPDDSIVQLILSSTHMNKSIEEVIELLELKKTSSALKKLSDTEYFAHVNEIDMLRKEMENQ